MKFTTVLAVLASAVAVFAQPSETNAERFARGLPPLPPARRGTPVAGKFHPTVALIIYSDGLTNMMYVAARRSQPSGGINNSCNTGPIQCCALNFSFLFLSYLPDENLGNSVTHANDEVAAVIIALLGLVVPADVSVGLTCSPLSVVGLGHNSW